MHKEAFPYIGLLSLFWGTNIVASRYGIGEFNPYLFLALRLLIATLIFVPIMWFNGRSFPRDLSTWIYGIISGILGVAIPMSGFILSLQYQSSGVTSIYVTVAPALVVVAAHFFLPDEKLNYRKGFGVILAFLGSLFLVFQGESGLATVGRANPLGFILIMAGLCSETVNTIFVRLRMKELDSFTMTSIRLMTAAVIVTTVALFVTPISFENITPAGYFSLGYAAIIGALAGQFMGFYITRRFGATAFSLVAYLIPVVAIITGVVVLNEIVTWSMLGGVLLIGTGIFLINRRTYSQLVAVPKEWP